MQEIIQTLCGTGMETYGLKKTHANRHKENEREKRKNEHDENKNKNKNENECVRVCWLLLLVADRDTARKKECT